MAPSSRTRFLRRLGFLPMFAQRDPGLRLVSLVPDEVFNAPNAARHLMSVSFPEVPAAFTSNDDLDNAVCALCSRHAPAIASASELQHEHPLLRSALDAYHAYITPQLTCPLSWNDLFDVDGSVLPE
jgi:hypothetical protein